MSKTAVKLLHNFRTCKINYLIKILRFSNSQDNCKIWKLESLMIQRVRWFSFKLEIESNIFKFESGKRLEKSKIWNFVNSNDLWLKLAIRLHVVVSRWHQTARQDVRRHHGKSCRLLRRTQRHVSSNTMCALSRRDECMPSPLMACHHQL